MGNMSKIPHLPTMNVSAAKIKRKVKQILKSAAYNTHTHTYVCVCAQVYKYIDYIDRTDCITLNRYIDRETDRYSDIYMERYRGRQISITCVCVCVRGCVCVRAFQRTATLYCACV